MNYYDAILALIPIPLLGGVGLGDVGIVGGGVLSMALLAHALFVNPPTDLSALHPKE